MEAFARQENGYKSAQFFLTRTIESVCQWARRQSASPRQVGD
jgi:hypothetical protein